MNAEQLVMYASGILSDYRLPLSILLVFVLLVLLLHSKHKLGEFWKKRKARLQRRQTLQQIPYWDKE